MDGAGRLGWLRWSGLAATSLMAAGAYGAGALPSGDPAPGLRSGLSGTSIGFRVGLLACLVGTAGLVTVWWRLAYTQRVGSRVPTRWVAVSSCLWVLPLLSAPPLASRDAYSYACQGWLSAIGSNPYDVSPLDGNCPWLGAVAPVWLDSTAPYGPAGIAVANVAAWLATQVSAPAAVQLTVFLVALRVLILAAVVVTALAGARLAHRCGTDPARAAVLGLATPLVAIHALGGLHLDVVVVAVVVTGLWVASVRTASMTLVALAGALIGLAGSVKVTALVAVPFAIVLAAGAPPATNGGRPRRLVVVTPVVAIAAAAAVAAVTAAMGLGYGWVEALHGTTDLVQWTSVPTALGMCAGYLLRVLGFADLFDPAVSVARLVGLTALGAAVLVLTVRAWHRRTDTRAVLICCGWAVVASVVLAPILYPWYALLPLAVLAAAGPGPRAMRSIMALTVLLTVLVVPNGLGVATLTKAPGAFAVCVGVLVASAKPIARLLGMRRRGAEVNRPVLPAIPPPPASSSHVDVVGTHLD